jgi:outer membrane immunogenic protein
MSRFVFLAVAASLGLGIAQSASAADIPAKAPVVAPYNYSWTGWYGGMNAGYSWGASKSDFAQGGGGAGFGLGLCTTDCAYSLSNNPKGFIGGLQAGYNYQAGAFVYGIEADFDWRHGQDSSAIVFNPATFDNEVVSSTQEWVGTLRGRLGYALAPNWLAYVSGGLAYGRFDHSVTQTLCNGVGNCSPSRAFTDGVIKVGWVFGGGVDYAINRNWSVGAEYLYMKFATDTLSASAATVGGVLYPATTGTFRDSSQVARLRLNYKFN